MTRCALLLLFFLATTLVGASEPAPLSARLLATAVRHLDLLLGPDGSTTSFKGKTTEGDAALAFYLAFEKTGDQRYRKAALELADRTLQAMRATKFGVLAIKEKDKPGGETIMGGGPPALGFYTLHTAYILHREGGRADDLRYLARVLDEYAWNDQGWWSADVDITTGESKVPISKPAPVNKTATMAMAAGAMSPWLSEVDPERAASLKRKADLCLYQQVIPAQLADGFWHYSLAEKDPKNKDILGYFMLTTRVLSELQHFNPAYREPRLEAALQKARAFALQHIAPMTDPNTGTATSEHTTPQTPKHYNLAAEPKRGFELAYILLTAGHEAEGTAIMEASLAHFPYGNAGQDGAHAITPIALLLARETPARR